ncbi:MAG: MSMEG_0570 family nitrogen starvation response protein, partial [Mycobacteriaceae bacterium]
MPEMTFTVQWPDGKRESCYSPSLVMHDYLTIG